MRKVVEQFLSNKYYKIYFSIIERAQSRNSVSGYTELHHIIPKALGGSDEQCNLVRLYPKEHYLCHRLLTKFTTGQDRHKMIYAITFMATGNRHHKRYLPTGRTYAYIIEEARKVHSIRMTENNPMHYPKIKEKHMASIVVRGKTSGMAGKEHSVHTKKLMSEKKVGKRLSNSSKKKISDFMLEISKSEDYVNPMFREGVAERHALACIERSMKYKTTCLHCNRTFTNNTYARFHGDKCKEKSHA